MNKVVSGFLHLMVIFSSAFIVFSSEQIKDDYLNTNRPVVAKLTNQEGSSGGTGFYVRAPSGKTYIMTNAHVCGLAKDGLIYVRNKETTIESVLEIYPQHDLCLIEAPAGAKGLKVARSVRTGENIYILGHPFLEPKSLSKGQLSGEMNVEINQGPNGPCEGVGYRKVELDPNDLMAQIFGIKYMCIRSLSANPVTANILPGNSGSPVLNAFGHVVGVAFAGIPGSGRGYIVPLSFVKDFLVGK